MALDVQTKCNIIRAHKQGQSYKAIAREQHKSLRDISDTINEYESARALLRALEELQEDHPWSAFPVKQVTIVRAFKQFEKEPRLERSLIKLGMEDPELLKKWYFTYLEFQGRSILQELYEKMGRERILAINESISKREEKGISEDEYTEGLKVERDVKALREELKVSQAEKAWYDRTLPKGREEASRLTNELPKLRVEKKVIEDFITEAEDHYRHIADLIWEVKKGEGWQEALKFTENGAYNTLTSAAFGDRALIGVAKAIRRDPSRYKVLYALTPDDVYCGVSENFAKEYQQIAKEIAHEINMEESQIMVRDSIVSATDKILGEGRRIFSTG